MLQSTKTTSGIKYACKTQRSKLKTFLGEKVWNCVDVSGALTKK